MIHMRKKLTLACVFAAVLMLLASAAFADKGIVTASSLHLREKASGSSEVLASIRKGTQLEILGKSGDWYKVTYGKLTGYVYEDYIDVIKDDGTLSKGDKGDEVKALQQRLKELGYYKSSCDGNYGNVTVNAVKAFQKKNGLDADGVADKATMKKLESSSAIKANGASVKEENKKEDDGALKKGSKGDEVKKVQQRLKELGYYNNTCDGSYGSQTVSAVKAFQKKNGLEEDGVCGAATLKKLNASSAKPAKDPVKEESKKEEDVLKQGAKGDEVKKLQKRLKELGYYSYGADGNFGSKTTAALKAFQKKNGLTQDGVAGASTQKKLYSSSAKPAKEETKEEDKKDDGALKIGAKGDEVKKIQKRLKELGYYNYPLDSQYGYRTANAIKAFQKKNGLDSDGVCGAATLKKLNSSSAIKANEKTEEDNKEDVKDDGTLKKGAKGSEVKKLQQRLKDLGYYNYTPDSSYGDRTVSAVMAFQKKNGLTADGVCGAATLKKINSSSAINAKGLASVILNTSQTLKKGDSGDQVRALQAQLKKLGYYTNGLDNNYGYQTANAVSAFQRANKLTVNGTANAATLRKMTSSSAVTKAQADKNAEEKDENKNDGKKYVTERLDWFKNGRSVFPSKAIIQVKDVRTGLIFKAKVLYGTNHLDVEPLTKADTAILLKINGGVDFSWRRRPMLVKYNGHVYAASIYSEPHGDQTILDNNFDGQFCLHFYGSKTHGTGEVKQDHQECVAQAMKATW